MDDQVKRYYRGRGPGPDHSGGRGRHGGGSFGPGGYCVCANCGEKVPHERGIRCTSVKCPKCGHKMVREELLNR